uniref:MFS transporter n=1 Tax=Cyberlindnera americana TaxID=36016 RepID=A0A5P8N8C5_9ASCO|nr:MFS transporter [Cyberlindnera americana]
MVSPKEGNSNAPMSAQELTNKLNEIDEQDGEQTISRRRQSSVSRPGLTFADLPTIPPPVPESLPTTPGYEISQRMFEQSMDSSLPQQQRPPLRTETTATTITKLIDYNEEIPNELTNDIMSIRNPPRNIYRVLAGCSWVFSLGMSDGALGALLPHIESYYGISYAIVSLLWLGNAIGYLLVAFSAHHIDRLLGMQKSLTLCVALFSVMFALISSGTLFPVLVVGFFFGGLGGAMALSQYNIFLSKLHNGPKYLGIFHGCYGLGAFISPLLGTAMINAGIKWHYFYFIPLGLSLFTLVFTPLAFQNCHIDLAKWDHNDNPQQENNDIEITEVQEQPATTEPKNDFKAALKDYRSWLTCSFIFFYQGAEVSIGGWMVTYLIDYRHADESSIGYVSSGIWGGVTLGRFLLTYPLSTYCGVRRSIMVLHVSIIVLDLLAWLVPNIIVDSVCASLIGLCIGPIYPMMVGLLTRILPRKIRFCAMTLGTAFGSSGGSAVPFTVGMASQFKGTYVLHPIFLVCFSCMFVSWILLPNIERKGAQSNLWQRFW